MEVSQEDFAQAAEQEELRQQQDMARQELLRRMCKPEALDRLRRVKLVKPALVDQVERFLEKQAMAGKIRSVVQESDIIDLLNKVGEATSNAVEKIVIARKKYADSDDDDDSDSDLR